MKQGIRGWGTMVEGLKYCINKFGFYSAGSEKSLLLRRGVLKLSFYFVWWFLETWRMGLRWNYTGGRETSQELLGRVQVVVDEDFDLGQLDGTAGD